ncbi:serine/threonine-protein phosphatase [Methanobrevibacter sp. OttesenSCG-928-K11]|nr:serine/threonine-protein phosphatase [Methanobrevibacter sp. OttesenSCG-928-K11]
MINSSNIKNKIKITIICILIYFIPNLILQNFLFPQGIFEFRISNGLPIVFGLLFGPYGAIGVLVGDLLLKISQTHSIETIILNPLVQFLGAYIPYKLWYSIKIFGNMTRPRLNNVENLIKFLIIVLINSIIISVLVGFIMDLFIFNKITNIDNLYYFFSNFNFSLILSILIIAIVNFSKIPIYIPKITSKENSVKIKIFNIIFIIAMFIALIYFIQMIIGIPKYYPIIGLIFTILLLVYCFKPLNIKINKNLKNKISLTEKLIVSLIITGILLIVLISAIFYTNSITMHISEGHFWETTFFYIALILGIFYIFATVFLEYIETSITYPIELLSDISKDYIKKNNKNNPKNILNKCEDYCNNNSEVGILTSSFKQMIIDFEDYIEQLKDVTAEKERQKVELDIAYKIQSSHIPTNFKDFSTDKIDVFGINAAAKEVGGDFYNFFLIDDNHLAIVMADVSGKGIPAALFMMVSKTLIENYAKSGKSPSEVFYLANNALCEDNEENMFVTAWMGILEISTGKFTFVNGGHEDPFIKENSEYSPLNSKPGFILGGMENIEYKEKIIYLKPNTNIFLYTDGITEANNENNEFFTKKRLHDLLNTHIDDDIKYTILDIKDKIEEFAGNAEQFDDITMLILEYK